MSQTYTATCIVMVYLAKKKNEDAIFIFRKLLSSWEKRNDLWSPARAVEHCCISMEQHCIVSQCLWDETTRWGKGNSAVDTSVFLKTLKGLFFQAEP